MIHPHARYCDIILITIDSGLLIFRFIEGEIAKTDTHLDILMDDMMYPAYSTAKIKSHHQKFEESESSPTLRSQTTT